MRAIELSESDYNDLMNLCKELQTQENDHQAFPYFWEPASYTKEASVNEEGEIKFYDNNNCCSSTPEEMWKDDSYEILKESFLELHEDFNENSTYEEVNEYDEWVEFIKDDGDFSLWYEEEVHKTEHNPSLFKSDVKNFITHNKHHLGGKPHTYARTIWRMPNMIKLVKILCNINKQENAQNEIKARAHK